MKVNEEKCISCGECVPYCIQNAINMKSSIIIVDRDLCVECGVCIDSNVCPQNAFEEEFDDIARTKKAFARITLTGRGRTCDVKNNDVTKLIPYDKASLRIEFHRPKGGVRLKNIEGMKKYLEGLYWNPKISKRHEALREEGITEVMLNQRILTGYLEFMLDFSDIPSLISDARKFSEDNDIYFSVNVACKYDVYNKLFDVVNAANLKIESVAKVNLGLGRKI